MMMTGKTITLDVGRLREMDVAPLAELFGAMVDIMAGGPAKGYDQAMSRRCGFDWILGDMEKRRTAARAAYAYGMRDTARRELQKICTDVYIAIRDFVDYTGVSGEDLDVAVEEAYPFTLEDEVWVGGQDYVADEVVCP